MNIIKVIRVPIELIRFIRYKFCGHYYRSTIARHTGPSVFQDNSFTVTFLLKCDNCSGYVIRDSYYKDGWRGFISSLEVPRFRFKQHELIELSRWEPMEDWKKWKQ